jgi:hypothetical protein
VVGIAYGYYFNQPEIIQYSILAFIGLEGAADVTGRYAANRYAVPAQLEQKTQLIQSGDLADDNSERVIRPGL